MSVQKSIIGRKAIVISLTESNKIYYPDIKLGMIVQIQEEHFNGDSFYIIPHDGTHKEQSGSYLGRLDRNQFKVVGIDKTNEGNLIVNCGKKATYFIKVCLGANEKGKYQYMKWTSLKTIIEKCV